MSKKNLLIVLSSENYEVAKNFPLLYSSVVLEREYWKSCHLMFWGPSIKTLAKSKKMQKRVLEIQKTGVTMSACIVCVQEYGLSKKLNKLNIELTHTGELLTKALKKKSYSILTI